MTDLPRPGPRNLITDVDGILVGNAEDARARTGVTVVLPDAPATMAAAITGGAPGTRETDALDPTCLVQGFHGLVLSGGSVFGLGAADGLVAWLSERGRGLKLGPRAIPVVPAAILFDLENGGDKEWGGTPPYAALGRAAAESMKARGRGSLVFFASMYGVVAPDPRIYREPLKPNPIDYGVGKAGLLQLARYFAVHYGPHGLRCNCVTPGPFPNPGVQERHPDFIAELNRKTALQRVGRNEEIVGPTLFLLSDAASYVTGHSLVVDGGWTSQ